MTWSEVYLICFLVGVGLSVLSLLAGSVHLHLPHLHLHTGIDVPHAHAGAGATVPASPYSTSGPSRRSWRGSAAPATCSGTTTVCGT